MKGMRVGVAPLRLARGVQIKILTAMAAGLPCVVTPCVAEGIEGRRGHELMIAESPYYSHIPPGYIDSLRDRVGDTPSYLVRGEPSTLDEGWNLYVPDYLHELMAGVR